MEEIIINDNKNNIVAKANELIRAQGELSITAQKMLAMLISMIRHDDTDFQEYALKIDYFFEQIGSSSNNIEQAKERALELMRNSFYVINRQGKKEFFNWCSKVAPYNLEGYIIFKIDNDLKPYLLNLKEQGKFTQYNLINILSLKGDYTPRFYEIILMYYNEYKKYNINNKTYTFELEIDNLRNILQIPNSYLYADIKRRIIDKAKEQFKAKTNIKFEYKEQKLGRKVVRIQVTVSDNLISYREFLKLLRTNGVNKDLLSANDKDTGQQMILSVSEKGRLYDKMRFNYEFTNERAEEIYKKLYDMYLDNKLKLN